MNIDAATFNPHDYNYPYVIELLVNRMKALKGQIEDQRIVVEGMQYVDHPDAGESLEVLLMFLEEEKEVTTVLEKLMKE